MVFRALLSIIETCHRAKKGSNVKPNQGLMLHQDREPKSNKNNFEIVEGVTIVKKTEDLSNQRNLSLNISLSPQFSVFINPEA